MEFPIEIVIGIVWILLALLRKRKRAPARLPEVETHEVGETVTTGDPRQDALDHLLRQFGMAAPSPLAAEPPPAPAPSEGFEHERHGFGSDNPLSEDAFEDRPAFAPRAAPATTRYDPHALRRETPRRPTPTNWASRLASADDVRDAFILGEILEPRGRRPHRRAPGRR